MDGRVNDMDQYKLLVYFGWLGAMLIVGMVLRAKIPILRNMLMPSCVIGGTIGFFLINFGCIESGCKSVQCHRRAIVYPFFYFNWFNRTG